MSKGATDYGSKVRFKVGAFTLKMVKAFWSKLNPRVSE